MRVCVCVCVTTMIFQLDVIFFSPTPCELVRLHRCDIVNKESNLFPDDIEKKIETEKGW